MSHETSNNANTPAVFGENTAGGDGITGLSKKKGGHGVHGISDDGFGLLGESQSGRGVEARSTDNYGLRAHSKKSAGIRGSSAEGRGVEGWAIDSEGVVGVSTNGTGVWGQTEGAGIGVLGTSKGGGFGVYGKGDGTGVAGVSTTRIGVYGETTGVENGPAGVWGEHKGAGNGVRAVSKDGVGLAAFSTSNEAVHAETKSPGTAAIAAYNLNSEGTGAALFAKKEGAKGHAGFFVGTVWIGGELGVEKDIILANADCAEDFDIANAALVEPGTVMVLGDDGALQPGQFAYDKRVAGVVSGAGNYKPGIVLDKQRSQPNRKPIALLGKVYCKVDASYGPVAIGDLLTTSSTPGHAMKAMDQHQAFGAVIGKALRPLTEGQGLIPILVTLQ